MRSGRLAELVVRRALRNMVEQGRLHLLSVTVMALSLSVLGGFLVVAGNLAKIRAGLGDERRMTAFIAAAIDEPSQVRLAEEARRLPGVAEVELLTTSQASARFREALGPHGPILDEIGDDVVPASLEVVAAGEPSAEDLARLVDAVANLVGVEEVVCALEELARLSALVRVVELIAMVIGGLIGLVTVIVVANTIRLAVVSRREEIEILELVGATSSFVKVPFLLEGVLDGIAAGAISVALVWALHAALVETIGTPALGGFDASILVIMPPITAAALVAFGGLLGLLGGFVSVGRFGRRR